MVVQNSGRKRIAVLADGSVLSLADLPPSDTRWVASRKAIIVNALAHGLISRDEIFARYGLSEEELDAWQAAMEKHGPAALRVTTIQRYRQP
ncbi:MAG: DUF1153 domain-containing protein [Paracoccus sp. (in: a-proteobacteria)]|nr:DUF1153 domain-containing protein [Paracoccus sp. (in: a-proteobacteria)]